MKLPIKARVTSALYETSRVVGGKVWDLTWSIRNAFTNLEDRASNLHLYALRNAELPERANYLVAAAEHDYARQLLHVYQAKLTEAGLQREAAEQALLDAEQALLDAEQALLDAEMMRQHAIEAHEQHL